MGYMRHHAIVVTGWDDPHGTFDAAHAEAMRLMPDLTTPISQARMNAYQSFCILPDGSKEGWDESDRGDKERGVFISWLTEHAATSDGGWWVDWALVQFGDEEGDQRVLLASRGGDEP
jgi:hypothetical protein